MGKYAKWISVKKNKINSQIIYIKPRKNNRRDV